MSNDALDIVGVLESLPPMDRASLRGAGRCFSSKQIGPLVERRHHTIDDRLKVLKRRLDATDQARAGRMLIALEADLDPVIAASSSRVRTHDARRGRRRASTSSIPAGASRLDSRVPGLTVMFALLVHPLVMIQGLFERV